jgi:hypothetical protein
MKPYDSNIPIRKRSMQKFDKSPTDSSGNLDEMAHLTISEKLDDVESDEQSYNSKMKVECICPKCGQRHVKAFHWIGRGTPRIYCPACRGGTYE